MTFCDDVSKVTKPPEAGKAVTYSHHSTTAGASNKNLGRVCLVLLERPLDHVGNGVGVSATFVTEGLLAAHIPAGTRMGRTGVDDNEAILLRQRLVRAAVEVCLRCASAIMDGDNDSRGGSKLLRNVDVEACLGRCVERGYLRKSTRSDSTFADGCGCGYGQEARDKGKETHGVGTKGR